jgi:hypothetical protein
MTTGSSFCREGIGAVTRFCFEVVCEDTGTPWRLFPRFLFHSLLGFDLCWLIALSQNAFPLVYTLIVRKIL